MISTTSDRRDGCGMNPFVNMDRLRATATHITALKRKRDHLADLHDCAWRQMLTSVDRMYADGEIDGLELISLFESMSKSFGPGYTVMWDQCVSVPSGKVKWIAQHHPNNPGGSWTGDVDLQAGDPRPPKGKAVVYILFNRANSPVYVGSTGNFPARIKRHLIEKPETKRWTAYPCVDRDHAYALEVRMLREYRLPLNRRVGR
jgi:hypothetical protein